MARHFQIDDIVIVKDIGERCMRVVQLSEGFDEEANAHFIRVIFNVLDRSAESATPNDGNFNEDDHTIYYVTCEWFDDSGLRHEDTFEESKLQFCERLPPRTIVQGFTRKD